jgi:hypothetical protein
MFDLKQPQRGGYYSKLLKTTLAVEVMPLYQFIPSCITHLDVRPVKLYHLDWDSESRRESLTYFAGLQSYRAYPIILIPFFSHDRLPNVLEEIS